MGKRHGSPQKKSAAKRRHWSCQSSSEEDSDWALQGSSSGFSDDALSEDDWLHQSTSDSEALAPQAKRPTLDLDEASLRAMQLPAGPRNKYQQNGTSQDHIAELIQS